MASHGRTFGFTGPRATEQRGRESNRTGAHGNRDLLKWAEFGREADEAERGRDTTRDGKGRHSGGELLSVSKRMGCVSAAG